MKKDLAEILLMVSLRCREDMASLIPIMKELIEDDEEYKRISISMGSIVYDIGENIIEKIFCDYPDLKILYDARMEQFGRGYY